MCRRVALGSEKSVIQTYLEDPEADASGDRKRHHNTRNAVRQRYGDGRREDEFVHVEVLKVDEWTCGWMWEAIVCAMSVQQSRWRDDGCQDLFGVIQGQPCRLS